MKKILIIGQGLAGTLLAQALLSRNAGVRIADQMPAGSSPHSKPERSASSVAAGIINPVTGKRFVKSWRFDTLFAHAQSVYQALERAWGISCWQERPILRLLAGPGEGNDWSARCAQPDYTGHLSEKTDAGPWAALLKPGFQFGLIRCAAQVDLPLLTHTFREKAQQKGIFWEKQFVLEELESLYSEFDHLIFCDGYRSAFNPWFSHLPWQLAKGEALHLRFPGQELPAATEMLKRTMLLTPVEDGLYWCGATYEWHYPHPFPSEAGKLYILEHLNTMISAPYEIADHVAAVRPTVRDRRPLIGLHPDNAKIGIFNGLGTKGTLLAPYWADHFADHLLLGTTLDPEVSISKRG